MKRLQLLLLTLALMMGACEKDDNGPGAGNILHYDSENRTAPNLPAGKHEAAARFSSAELAPFAGRELTEVQFFIAAIPDDLTVKIYGPGDAGKPGALLYSAAISKSLNDYDWNTHELRRPIPINGDDLWISIALTHFATQQSIGCDAGPAAGDGDWLFQDSDLEWKTFRARTGENINWNIRAKVGE